MTFVICNLSFGIYLYSKRPSPYQKGRQMGSKKDDSVDGRFILDI
jgi:hypothetical protein